LMALSLPPPSSRWRTSRSDSKIAVVLQETVWA
jgi:hypothetical protein